MADPVMRALAYAEYLVRERASETKHEWDCRVALAMAGGTPEHGRLAARVAGILGAALAGRPCEVFSSDVRVRVAASDRAYYPDASVVCGKLETASDDPDAITNPIVIVQVLSESTESRDRGRKRREYQKLASLREYVLVAQSEPHVEVWRRRSEGWQVHDHGPGASVTLEALEVTFAVDDLYRSRLASG